MHKHILAIGGIPSLHQLFYQQGVRITLLPAGGFPAKPDSSIYHNIVDLPLEDQRHVLKVLKAIHAHHAFTDILCLHDCAIETGVIVANELQLPFFDEITVRRSLYKNEMRDRLHSAGLDRTPYAVIDSPDELKAFAQLHDYPLVIKPINGRASQGVQVLDSSRDIPELITSDYLVEKKLTGIEISVESYSREGQFDLAVVTEKFKSGVVECGHVMPPISLTKQTCKQVVSFVEQTLQALGQDMGLGHTEAFIDDTDIAVVETHLRGGGDRILDLVTLTTGYELSELLVADKLGKTYKASTSKHPAAAVWFLLPEKAGVLESIGNFELAREMPGVYDISLLKKNGDTIGLLQSSYDRLALVVAYGDNPQQALLRAQQASAKLSIKLQ